MTKESLLGFRVSRRKDSPPNKSRLIHDLFRSGGTSRMWPLSSRLQHLRGTHGSGASRAHSGSVT